MISFIVIGRNEGWKLTNCLASVFKTIEHSKLSKFEIIYVDSNSTDDSIKRAKLFENVKVLKLTNDCNAAIARNSGVQIATGDIFYFIDGDMEITSDFLQKIYNKDEKLIHPFISGQYINYFYNKKGELLNKEHYDKSLKSNDQYRVITGGLFIVQRKHWNLVNGMKNKHKMGEDMDFGLRLAKKGVKLLRKKEIMAIHHTISYRDNKRMWYMLFNKAELYAKSMLYRDHLFNKNIYPIIARNDYSLIILLISIILSFFISPLFILFYCLIATLRSVKASNYKLRRFLSFLAYFTLRDIIVLGGFFFFFPKTKFSIKSVVL